MATPQLHLIGEIKSAKNFESNRLFCKWEFKYGKHLTVIDGNTEGETFEEEKPDKETAFYFDHPFDIHFKVESMRGWPKVVVEVWEVADDGKYFIAGYGTGTIPCSPGSHNIEIKCWRPKDQTWYGYLRESLLGVRSELATKEMLLSSMERNLFESETTGSITVDIGIIAKDFELYGIKLS
ncbi:unnamed protein product [Moneuplotes crassus]|uniref:B9 domain-containing protein 2 n=1 Tax=Euplotes crassus TaxID=5936 RepID=A0AAD1Y0X8_EUPCR|nr:unnamed protein product [Moneuplotes crassus]